MREDGADVVMLESDSHLYPVEAITDYDQYMDMKPPEPVISKIPKDDIDEHAAATTNATTTRKTYRCYKDEEKEELFFLVYEKGMSVRAAALQLQIKPRTAQYWVQQDQKDPKDHTVSRRKVAVVDHQDEHKSYLTNIKNSSLTLSMKSPRLYWMKLWKV